MEVYNAALQSLGDAMSQQQAGDISLTQPQMDAINNQAEVVQARANELAVQGEVGNTYSAQQTITQAEQLVTALQALPPDIKTKIGYEGVFNAFLSAAMNGGDAQLAQTALDKAKAGIQAALKSPSLDVGTRAALEGLLEEIDSGAGVRDNRSEFRYEHNPMDNPKAAKDIVENPNAVYGYSPNPKSERIGKFAEFDWTNKDVISSAREARMQYHNDNAAMYNLVKEMQRNGATIEEIAKAANQQRNLNRLQSYIDTGNMVGYKMAVESNMRNFNNEIGMTAEQAYDKYKSWDAVLEKAMSANAGMDACCGLYDEFYYLY